MGVKHDHIGDTYDATRRSDPRIADQLTLLLGTVSAARGLGVACGTVNYTSTLAAPGRRDLQVRE